MSEHKCEVCDNEPIVGVAAIPWLPMSVGYGAKCLNVDAHPAWALRANAAICGGIVVPEYLDMIVYHDNGYMTFREYLLLEPLSQEELDGPPQQEDYCPACAGKRRHTTEETKYWHPLAGHGFTKEHGYTCPEAEALAIEESKAIALVIAQFEVQRQLCKSIDDIKQEQK